MDYLQHELTQLFSTDADFLKAYTATEVFRLSREDGHPIWDEENPVCKHLPWHTPATKTHYLAYYRALQELTHYPSVALSLEIANTLYNLRKRQASSFTPPDDYDAMGEQWLKAHKGKADYSFVLLETSHIFNFNYGTEALHYYLAGTIRTLFTLPIEWASIIFTLTTKPLWEGKTLSTRRINPDKQYLEEVEITLDCARDTPALVWVPRQHKSPYEYIEATLDANALPLPSQRSTSVLSQPTYRAYQSEQAVYNPLKVYDRGNLSLIH